jgi:hypothetical protein
MRQVREILRLLQVQRAGTGGSIDTTTIERKLDRIFKLLGDIMPTLDELQTKAQATLDKVTSDTDLDNAVATVVNNQNATIADLKAQLAAAGTDPAKLQALSDTMDAILKTDTSNADIVSSAVTAGTPVPTPKPDGA